MKLLKGMFFERGNYSFDQLIKYASEFEDVKYDHSVNGYTSPVTYRNFIRANREKFYEISQEISQEVSSFDSTIKSPTGEKVTFWKHQQDISDWEKNKKQCIIAAEPRTGKTLPTIDTCAYVSSLFPNEKTLIYWIAPKSGVKSVMDEFQKWFPNGHSNGKTLFEIRHNCTIELMTYEKWRRDWIQPTKFKTLEEWNIFINYVQTQGHRVPRVCIFDEVHKIKAHKGLQGKMSRLMRLAQEVVYESTNNFYTIGLSGTPSPKSTADWWNILEMIAPGYLKESSPDVLTKRLAKMRMEKDEATGMAFPKIDYWIPEKIAEFNQEINPLVLTVWKKDVLDLPDKKHDFIFLQQTEEIKQAIRFLKADPNCNGATLRQKMRQISDGFLYLEDYNAEKNLMERVVEHIETPKQTQLVKDLKKYGSNHSGDWFPWQTEKGNRVLITGGYHGTIDTIVNTCLSLGWDVIEMTGKGWRTHEIVNTFDPNNVFVKKGNKSRANQLLKTFDRSLSPYSVNDKKIAVVGHPKTMATGLEFSRCSLMIAFSHTDDGESEMQVLDRPHSNNMDKIQGFNIIHYCHVEYDYLIAKALQEKKKFQTISMSSIEDAKIQDLWENRI